jgi:hypothetical protein
MIIPGGETGEVVDKGKIVRKEYQKVDTDTLEYCWLHNLELTSDWKNPNEEDKKKLDQIRLKAGEVTDKKGNIKKFRFCPKCMQTIEYTKQK